MDVLVSWGFNVVRLGFVWNMYETAPGVYNETFMDGVEDLVNRFAAKGAIDHLLLLPLLYILILCMMCRHKVNP